MRDPTLYLVVALTGWRAKEPESASAQRLRRLHHVLQERRWMPSDAIVPERGALEWTSRRLWSEWEPRDDWNVHWFAHSYHEMIVVLVGVEQDGSGYVPQQWIPLATERWANVIVTPEDGEQGADPTSELEQLSLLGRAWIWTGEWDVDIDELPNVCAPVEARLGESQPFVHFQWGLLGHDPGGAGGLPRFVLHTTVADKRGRDLFLFSNFTMALMEYLKATQFLRTRFREELTPRLNELEQKILANIELPRDSMRASFLMRTESAVRSLTVDLSKFAQALADLEDDAQSAEIAGGAVTQWLEADGTAGLSRRSERQEVPLAQTVDLLARQMRSDLAYFRTSEARGHMALATHRTLVEIEETRAQKRLALIGVVLTGFALTFGIGQFLEEFPREWQILVSMGGGVVLTAVAWMWIGRSVR